MNSTIQEVKKKHQNELMSLPGVVSVGIGLNDQGQQVIVVGMSEDKPVDKTKIPASIDGFTVTVKLVGTLKAQ